MIAKEDILTFLSEHKSEFKKDLQIDKIGLFGSYARDEQTDESDIDLIVEFDPKTDHLFEKKSELKIILEKHFHKKVDVCREKYIKPYFRKQILTSAIYV